LRAYAPPRPVRLLGVRVAAFEEPEAVIAADDPQLALPLTTASSGSRRDR
jgi:hypothetical protein